MASIGLVAGAVIAASVAGAEAPAKLIYGSFRPANWDIFDVASPDAEKERLTDYSGLDYDPVISADGRYVVFTSERAGTHRASNTNPVARTRATEIYVHDLKSNQTEKLTGLSKWSGSPVWSQDGTEILHYTTNLPGRPALSGAIRAIKIAERTSREVFRAFFSV